MPDSSWKRLGSTAVDKLYPTIQIYLIQAGCKICFWPFQGGHIECYTEVHSAVSLTSSCRGWTIIFDLTFCVSFSSCVGNLCKYIYNMAHERFAILFFRRVLSFLFILSTGFWCRIKDFIYKIMANYKHIRSFSNFRTLGSHIEC